MLGRDSSLSFGSRTMRPEIGVAAVRMALADAPGESGVYVFRELHTQVGYAGMEDRIHRVQTSVRQFDVCS